MRILILTQWFQPEPTFKGLPFAKGLSDHGNEVEILTGFPNYPEGKIYPGYRLRLWQRETIEKIKINRVALFPSHDQSGWKRIINYLSFAISSMVFGLWLVKRPQIIYVFNLVTLMPFAYVLRLTTGAKIVLDVQDLWPESVAKSNMMKNKFLLRMLQAYCMWAYNQADWLTVLSPGFKANLATRGVSMKKIEVIYNWCDETALGEFQIADLPQIKEKIAGKFPVVFAGTMGKMQGLDTVLKAAFICQEKVPDACFILIGGGIERHRLENRARDLGLSNVLFVNRRPQSEMGYFFGVAGALLVHLKDDPLCRMTIPSKTQAYLFMGKPIIMAVAGDAANLIKDAGAGISCQPDHADSLVKAVERFAKMSAIEREKIGLAGAEYYRHHMAMAIGLRRFVDRFEELIKENRGK